MTLPTTHLLSLKKKVTFSYPLRGEHLDFLHLGRLQLGLEPLARLCRLLRQRLRSIARDCGESAPRAPRRRLRCAQYRAMQHQQHPLADKFSSDREVPFILCAYQGGPLATLGYRVGEFVPRFKMLRIFFQSSQLIEWHLVSCL